MGQFESGQRAHGEIPAMMCIGWRSSDKCGRKDQVTTPAAVAVGCPNISWFWVGLAAVVLAGFTKKKEA